VAQKEGKNLAGDAGKAAKSKYEELAKNYGHTTRALRVLAIGGLVLYLSKTDEVKPEDLIKEFIKNAMLVSATTSCSRSVEAVQKILDADRQAAKLRQEIAAINEKFALTSAQP
jgi:gamma-glutamyl:cysteine ligase YbdK (ATP-grasp superfamily)